MISYEGTTAQELIGDFHEAVDGYLALCEEEGIESEIAYKGSFNFVEDAIATYVAKKNV